MMSLEWSRRLLKQCHGKYPLEHSKLVIAVSVQAFLSNSHQAVPSATLVVWTQGLWSCQGTAQCLGVGCSQEMHTLVEISASSCLLLGHWGLGL